VKRHSDDDDVTHGREIEDDRALQSDSTKGWENDSVNFGEYGTLIIDFARSNRNFVNVTFTATAAEEI